MQSAAAVPFVLHGDGATCRVRSWSGDPSVAQLVLYQQRRTPTPDDVRRWVDDLTARGFRRVRTGALNTAQAASLTPHGFQPIQRARPARTPLAARCGAVDCVHRQARRRRVRGGERRRSVGVRRRRGPRRHGRRRRVPRRRTATGRDRSSTTAASWPSPSPDVIQVWASSNAWPSTRRTSVPASASGWCSTACAGRRAGAATVCSSTPMSRTKRRCTLYARTGFVHLDEQLVVLEHPVAGGPR